MNFLAQKRKNTLLNFHKAEPQLDRFDSFYYKEIAKLTAAGGFSVNFLEKRSYLDPQARRILKTPPDFRPSLKIAINYFAPSCQERAMQLFKNCIEGTPFTTEELKMVDYTGREFWVKAMGTPIYSEDNQIIGLQGVFQDIDETKKREIHLKKSMKVIESQNARLFNFAHIVSHNLRSHASNLHLTLDLMRSISDISEEKELKNNLYDISKNLNTTIDHLNEIVLAQTKSLNERSTLDFKATLQTVLQSLDPMVEASEAEIYSDFSEVPQIEYIPAYMESILLNLLSNAIKYRHPDRNPVVDICTFMENGETVLMVRDNGSGIDLEKFGDKIFNMYQTFHSTKDSIGIGLFITKNQVETLQGSISVESTPNEGTTFKIVF